MKYFYVLFLLSLLASSKLHAQSNYKPGYIVTLNGDTTKGLIDYKEWGENPRHINFKLSPTGNVEPYGVQKITAFGVDRLEQYQRYIGPVSTHAVELPKISSSRDSAVVNDSVFLRRITAGKNAALFMYEDDLKNRFFIADGNSIPTELKYYRYLDNANKSIIIEATYRQQLQRLVAFYQPGNRQLIDQIQRADYQLKYIEPIILSINGYNGTKYAENSRLKTRLFVGVAANAVSTKFDGNYIFNSPGSSKSVMPQINVGLDLLLNKNVGKWLFRTELSVSGNRSNFKTGQNYSTTTGMNTFEYEGKINQVSALLTPQIVCNIYNANNLKVYLSGGVTFNINLQSTRSFAFINNINHTVTEVYGDEAFGFKTLQYGVSTAAGVMIKRIAIYLGYNPPMVLGSSSGSTLYLSSFRAGVNYTIGKKQL